MSDQQIQRVKVGRLAHVGIWTTDVAAQARFYHQVAGLGVRATSAGDIDLEDANVFLVVRDEQPIGPEVAGQFVEVPPAHVGADGSAACFYVKRRAADERYGRGRR